MKIAGLGRWLMVLLALGLAVSGTALAEIQVTVLPSLAPNVYGSPSWNQYTQNAIYAIEHGLASYGDVNSPTYYNQQNHFTARQTIVTGFPSWLGVVDPAAVYGPAFANELGNRMHFGFDIVATGGETFRADDISFASLAPLSPGLNWSWGAGPWDYQPWRIGIAADGTIYNNGEAGSLPVVRMISVGSGNSYPAYCPGCTPAQQQAELDAVAIAGGGYTYTGTYSVTGSSGQTYSGSGEFDVAAVPEPGAIVLFGAAAGLLAILQRRR